jgi:anti-sigma regulatory factor (Ser/Thr protein kinase)
MIARLWDTLPVDSKERSGDDFRFVVGNDERHFGALIRFLQELVVARGGSHESDVQHIGLALVEALNNAAFHGNLEVGSELRGEDPRRYYRLIRERRGKSPWKDRRIRVEAELTAAELRVRLRDEGPGFDPDTLPDPTRPENLLAASGRGVFLMRAFMDDVVFNEAGNEVTLTKRFGRSNGEEGGEPPSPGSSEH